MVREVELFQYFPAIIQGIREFQEIAETETPEFNRAFLDAEARLSDSFIREATARGIKRYEKMLGLASISRLTLDERRTKVLIKWNRQLPYTLRRLTEQLALWSGNEAFTVDISRFKEYELRIEIFNQTLEMLREIKEMTGEMIPANLLLFIYGRYPSKYNVPVRYENTVHIQTSFHPRYNLPFLLLDRTWKLDGSRQMSGYASDDVLDFYPVGLRLQAEAVGEIRTEERLRLAWEGRVEITTESALDIQMEAAEKIQTGERVRMQAESAYHIKTASYMTKMNQTDGTWKLNGSRKLDGGHYTL